MKGKGDDYSHEEDILSRMLLPNVEALCTPGNRMNYYIFPVIALSATPQEGVN